MVVSTRQRPRRSRSAPLSRTDRAVLVGLLVLTVVPALAGSVRVGQLAAGVARTPDNARFVDAPWPVVAHVLSVVPYAVLGAFQVVPGFRRRHPGGHRRVGRLLVPLGAVVALSGLWMTVFYDLPVTDGARFGPLSLMRLVVGLVMLGSLAAAVAAVPRRDWRSHGAWMLRAYALAMGAGTQVVTNLPYFALVGQPGEGARAVLMGAGWLVNVVVAEIVISAMRRKDL